MFKLVNQAVLSQQYFTTYGGILSTACPEPVFDIEPLGVIESIKIEPDGVIELIEIEPDGVIELIEIEPDGVIESIEIEPDGVIELIEIEPLAVTLCVCPGCETA